MRAICNAQFFGPCTKGLATVSALLLSLTAVAAEPAYKDLNRTFEERAADSRLAHDARGESLADSERRRRRFRGSASRSTTGGTKRCTASRAPARRRYFRRRSDSRRPSTRTLMHDVADGDQRRSARQAPRVRATRPARCAIRDSRSGRRTSTSSAIRAGAAARRPTAKIRSSRRAWAWLSSTACRATIREYLKIVATAKHYAVHSGPEPERHHFDVHPSERDLHETYLPAFRALVQEGHVDSVMGAYNRVNGESASASPRLLQDILREEWGFKGYVVSDCDAIDDIFTAAQDRATPPRKLPHSASRAARPRLRHDLRRACRRRAAGADRRSEIDVAVTPSDARALASSACSTRRSACAWAQIPYSVNQSPRARPARAPRPRRSRSCC